MDEYDAKATFFACALALDRNREVDPQLVRRGQEVSGHGHPWEEYPKMDLETELADPLFIGSFKQPSRESLHAGELLDQPLRLRREILEQLGVLSKIFRRSEADFHSGHGSSFIESRVPYGGFESSLPHPVDVVLYARRRNEKPAHAPESIRHLQCIPLLRRRTHSVCDRGYVRVRAELTQVIARRLCTPPEDGRGPLFRNPLRV